MENKIREVILCKYGEVILKGDNRRRFETQLLREIRRRAALFGNYDVIDRQSTVCVEPLDERAEEALPDLYVQVGKVFGLSGIARCAVAEKDMDDILRVARAYLPDRLRDVRTFKCEAKRSDKTFPLDSMQIAAVVGGAVLESSPHLKVNVTDPDVVVRIEIRERHAYLHAGQDHGASGMPTGSAGRGLLLLSGGIDSPVAGYTMMKRGVTVECVHFESFPYTSEAAREKVFRLAEELTEYCGRIKVHVISLTRIQETLRDTCEEDYFTLLLRRFMMRLSSRLAEELGCGVLITGESLGQVASQTMKALRVTEDAASLPVFRPLIGMDKAEIISISRRIGTFETSILPYEDCCTVFTPRHPKTQPVLERVLEQEAKVDIAALEEEAWATRNCRILTQEL